jgi:hypothetical protein
MAATQIANGTSMIQKATCQYRAVCLLQGIVARRNDRKNSGETMTVKVSCDRKPLAANAWSATGKTQAGQKYVQLLFAVNSNDVRVSVGMRPNT